MPEIAGVEFNPPRRTFNWQEPVHREEFRLRASPESDGKTVRGRLTVFLGTMILADVALSLRVDSTTSSSSDDPADQESARPYRKIFASYSHRDLDVVKQVEHFCLSMGDQYLRDWTHLRSGEVWNDRLLKLIEEADVFQLFWSKNSMNSGYCKQEWEHALRLGRPNFVRPVYWEEPLPTAADGSLPPPELRRLHFQKLALEVPVLTASAVGTHPVAVPVTEPVAPHRGELAMWGSGSPRFGASPLKLGEEPPAPQSPSPPPPPTPSPPRPAPAWRSAPPPRRREEFDEDEDPPRRRRDRDDDYEPMMRPARSGRPPLLWLLVLGLLMLLLGLVLVGLFLWPR